MAKLWDAWIRQMPCVCDALNRAVDLLNRFHVAVKIEQGLSNGLDERNLRLEDIEPIAKAVTIPDHSLAHGKNSTARSRVMRNMIYTSLASIFLVVRRTIWKFHLQVRGPFRLGDELHISHSRQPRFDVADILLQ